jgi:hypothetical protein
MKPNRNQILRGDLMACYGQDPGGDIFTQHRNAVRLLLLDGNPVLVHTLGKSVLLL